MASMRDRLFVLSPLPRISERVPERKQAPRKTAVAFKEERSPRDTHSTQLAEGGAARAPFLCAPSGRRWTASQRPPGHRKQSRDTESIKRPLPPIQRGSPSPLRPRPPGPAEGFLQTA
ncbi:hypothetical protein AAFF_G00309530 [Aldrovandia affinis]|uniref:Uncharacterized protein n=1 Tax=Aldrovandia affinis TaxID=143900 RepID=A0AAD7WR78_9TELE|nr:hypothetical protein AAFF_G00309530 [Aldrovandia affinis]